MNKNVTIFTAVLAVVFGLLLGLAKSEDKNYSYEVGRKRRG